jgi:hypothetical protein
MLAIQVSTISGMSDSGGGGTHSVLAVNTQKNSPALVRREIIWASRNLERGWPEVRNATLCRWLVWPPRNFRGAMWQAAELDIVVPVGQSRLFRLSRR